ncbi:MAG: universal stress protein [Tunicatimonas sp.]
MDFQRILLMTDFSEDSRHALAYGLQLAKLVRAQVWVQHVYYIPPDAVGEVSITREALQNHEQQMYREFETLRQKLAIDPDVELLVEHGDLISQMNALIDREHIDLVIVGNRGKGFLTNLLGSNTVKIIHHARCSVLAVPEKAPFPPFQRLLFAADLQRLSPPVLTYINKFTQHFPAPVDIIHVYKKGDHDVENPKQLDKVFDLVPHTFYYEWTEDVEEGIQRHIAEHGNDLLMLVPRAHPLFDKLFQRSISRKLAYHSQVPLLAIRDPTK